MALGWDLSWGHELATLQEIKQSTGVTPRALLDKPELSQYESYCYDFYQTLSRSRNYFYGPQPISISEVTALLKLHDLYDYSERLWLLSLVQELDTAFINHQVKKQETDPDTEQGK